MLTVISPAKRLDLDPVTLPGTMTPSEPAFAADAARLARAARRLSVAELRDLMAISEPLAALNRDRFKSFAAAPQPDQLHPAALMFAGDTYIGLEAKTLSEDALRWAQDRLRILSGLYGLLRPLDAIQPYRLEMGSKLATARAADLYGYWGTRLARALNAQAKTVGTGIVVNCASQEYFGAVDKSALKLRVITPVFLEDKAGDPKVVSFFAKQARGAMARFIAENRLTDPASLQDFDLGGYRFQPQRSDGDRWAFLRPAA
ncbi:MAG: peroxide stress protein YaaA [Rhodobacter sp.]|nr:peroxide stress protein YaaA [Rhodobacter sp.]